MLFKVQVKLIKMSQLGSITLYSFITTSTKTYRKYLENCTNQEWKCGQEICAMKLSEKHTNILWQWCNACGIFSIFWFLSFFFNLLYNKQWQGSDPIVPYYFGKVWDHGGLGEPQSHVSYAWVQKAKTTQTHTSFHNYPYIKNPYISNKQQF